MSFQTTQHVFQDPYTYYTAFLGTIAPSGGNTNELAQFDDGYTCQTATIGPQDLVGYQQQIRTRAIPYHLAVRFPNRSNGAPLATIIEQGSYSTLNSRASLLSVGRFPSIRVAENTSPSRASHRISRSLDENTLHRIQEHGSQEQDLAAAIMEAHVRPQDWGRSRPILDTTTPMNTIMRDAPQSPGSHIGGTDMDSDHWKPKGFLRGVLHNVRAASRPRSRSPSMTHIVEARDDRSEASDGSPLCQLPGHNHPRQETDVEIARVLHSAQKECLDTPLTPIESSQARSRKIPMTDPQTPAATYPPLLESSLPLFEPDSAFGQVPHLLSPPPATRSRERSSSVRLVPPEPRDVACVDGTAGLPTLSTHNDHISARQTFDGASETKHSSSSLKTDTRVRGASRNASFCSTMSTSYSGTVLGVDLDLHHETPQAFTPQMAELERQASISESPDSPLATTTQPTGCSITSSALPSLLPIAAASGIVQPNYNTPKISFYSPSGRLIQPEGSSSPETSAFNHGVSPTARTPNHNKTKGLSAQHTLTATACLPPARPTLLPMTTPPSSSAPLPYHLRHHHNYRHPERSHIESCESLLEHASAVNGCGGIVRTSSFALRSRTRSSPPITNHPSSEHKQHRSPKSILHDLKGDMSFYKSRYIARAAQSCGPTPKSKRKGNKLHKRQAASQTSTVQHASKLRTRSNGAEKSNHRKTSKTTLAPLASYALRICFCQPYDGAGMPSRTDPACTTQHSRPTHAAANTESDRHTQREAAARPLTATHGQASDRRSKTNSSARPHARIRSDSAVSVGAAVRVAVVGGTFTDTAPRVPTNPPILSTHPSIGRSSPQPAASEPAGR
ncbi:hypothetical protein CC86DRAFT_434483 [Ophiobolus disseminans]|uniref:Uncharacterized protein n=1 Tax=Ophiobolus disseminans TaxID=1469910 RepID=A0A6A7ABL9_9PLEO|nr:hypothetical protein CC86DRAFT_434483 [Ophiobolus disseminans]